MNTRRALLAGASASLVFVGAAPNLILPASARMRGGISSVPVNVRQVATRTITPNFLDVTNKQQRGRRMFYTRSAVTSIRTVWPGFYVDDAGAGSTFQELGPGASQSIDWAIEYPIGVTYVQGTFNTGSVGGTIPNVGTLTSDDVPISIPAGALAAIRFYITCTAGSIYAQTDNVGSGVVPGNATLGDVLNIAPSGLSNNVLGGAYGATSGFSSHGPMVTAGPSNAPAPIIFGNSLTYAQQDIGDSSGDLGDVARSIGPTLAYACFGHPGDSCLKFKANSALRRSVLPYFSSAILELVTNDLAINSQTSAQTIASTAAIEALLGNFPKWLTTCTPAPSSTDNYATLGNQTVPSWEAARVAVNTSRRTVPDGWSGFFDVANSLESSFNSGKIPAGSGYLNSVSSIHLTPTGYLQVQSSGVINPSVLI